MQLQQIKLTNYCCHESKVVVFDSGFIGLVGGNGTGKSSVLDGIRFALVGQSVNDGTKKSNIRSNAPAKAPSNVELRLSHGGRTATITRHLRPATPARIVFDNETTDITGEAEVTSHVLTWLGITDDLLQHVVCASQEDLFGFANMTSGARAKFFQSLFGLDHLQSLRKKVQDFIAARKIVSYDTVLASTDDAIRQHQQELVNLQLGPSDTADEEVAAVRQAEQSVTVLKSIAEFMQEADKAEANVSQLMTAGQTAANLVAEAEAAFAAIEARYNEAQRTADNSEHILKAHAEAVRVAAEFKKAAEFICTLEANLSQATARLEEAKASPLMQGVADPAQSLRQFGQLLAVASARVSTAEQAWARYTNTPDTCPTCKQPMQKDSSCAGDLQAEFEESKREYTKLQAEYAAFEQAANVLQRAESNFNSYNTEMRYKRDAFQDLQARATKTQGDLLTPERLVVLDTANKELIEARVAYAAAKQKLERANADVSQLRAQYAVWAQKVRENNANPLATACIIFRQDLALMPAEMQAAQQQHEICKQQYLSKIQRLAQRDAVVKEIQRLETQRQKLLQEAANQQLSAQKYAQLARVTELLHSDAVPKYIATQNLQLLQGEINRILGELSAKFRLKAEDDLTLVATWPDGRQQPLSRLSGGQKTVVAAVFRIAMSTVFTNNIGFLVLDEPTAFQDRAHIEGLIPALEALERYAENTGMQLLVVTHEPLLHPVFKRLIDLSA